MVELSTSALAGRYRLDESEEWRDLLTHLDFGDGFSLIVLLAPDSYGVEICRLELQKHFAEKARQLHILRIGISDPPEELARRLLQPIPSGVGVIWVEIAPVEPATQAALHAEPFDQPEQRAFRSALRALNPERNLLQAGLSAPLVVAGPVWLQTVFREAAPDLWSVRSTVINIHSDLAGTRKEFSELEMPVAKSFEPPNEGTLERVTQLRRDLERIKDKSGAELLRAELLRRLGVELTNMLDWPEAERVLAEAYRLCEEFHAPAQDHALVTRDLGRVLEEKGEIQRARHYFEVALKYEEAAFGSEHNRYGRACSDLGRLCRRLGDYELAEVLLRKALKIQEKNGGPNSVAVDLSNLASLLRETNRVAEAEPMMKRALAIDEKSYGPEHPNVAVQLNNLAQLLQETNRVAEAEPLMKRALAIDEKSYGPEHPRVAVHLNNLAQLLQDTNRLTEAEPLMKRALAIGEKSYGSEHPDVATDLNNLAQLLQATNRLAEAEPMMKRALVIDEKTSGPEHPNVARDLNNLARLLQVTNRLTEAEPLMKRALAIFLRSQLRCGFELPTVVQVTENYRGLLTDMARPESRIDEEIQKLTQQCKRAVDAEAK